MSNDQFNRRTFIKKSAYTVPVILSLAAMPGFATAGSGNYRSHGNNGVGNGFDPQPPGNPPINDGPGTRPGNPGNRGGN
jgi:hypothetical protein